MPWVMVFGKRSATSAPATATHHRHHYKTTPSPSHNTSTKTKNHHHHPPSSSRKQKTQRIVHRDIKSENVFRTDCGTWKLGDFGSALKLGDARTLERQVMGGGVGVGRGVV